MDGAVEKRRLRRSHIYRRTTAQLLLRGNELLIMIFALGWNEAVAGFRKSQQTSQ
jgi:hypothetical protein